MGQLDRIKTLQVAADDEESVTELAKKTQNPVADLISVPFQNNFNFNSGTKDATVYVLNPAPGFYNAETAGKSASDLSLRFQVQFLLPKF